MKNKLVVSVLLSILCIFSTGYTSQVVANSKFVGKSITEEKLAYGSYDYIIPYSDTKYLTYGDVKYLSKEELALARNEIFARHGHTFDKAKYRNYFMSKSWYTPIGKTNMKKFSKIENYNIQFIKSYENSIASEDSVSNSDYIIPYSDIQYLTYNDIRYLSKEELALARNEIFARHGHTFNKAKYRNYFMSKSWYTPIGKTNMSEFSDVEEYNINFIKSYE